MEGVNMQLDECSDDDMEQDVNNDHRNREGDEEATGQPEQSINDMNFVWNNDEEPEGKE